MNIIEVNVLDKVYVIMFELEIWESGFYTDETKVSERVEALRTSLNSNSYWYKTLHKI
jgi:hypothetical protein